ncbi:MAG: hypothetical protein ACR2JK_01470 [Geodermatophilaceae bacterium]
MPVDARLERQELAGHVVRARRDHRSVRDPGDQDLQPLLRRRCLTHDVQVLVEQQDDRPEIMPLRDGRFAERRGLTASKCLRQPRGNRCQEVTIRLVEQDRGLIPPQVQECPAAESIVEDHRGHVADAVAAQHLTPHRGGSEISSRAIGE